MSAADYADLLFLEHLASDEFDKEFGDGWRSEPDAKSLLRQIMRGVFSIRGYDVGEQFDGLVETNVDWLVEKSALAKEGDDYTGNFYKLRAAKKNEVITAFLHNQDVARRIRALGPFALDIALDRLAEENGWGSADDSLPLSRYFPPDQAPAADRVVSFSDNQMSDLEAMTSEVIDAVSAQNQIDQAPNLREIILGQLRAGRELIRAGSARLYLLELTLIQTLRFLAKRYEREAIGGLAAALIVALLKHMGIDA